MSVPDRVRALLAALAFAVSLAAPASAQTLGERVEAAIARAVLQQAGDVPTEVEIPPLADFAARDLDTRPVVVKAEVSNKRPLGVSVPVTVTLEEDGQRLRRGVVTVRVKRPVKMVVATRRLPRGTVIEAEDVKLETRDALQVKTRWASDPEQVVGLQVSRSIGEGRVLPPGRIAAAPVVRRGDRVRLRFHTGALRIDGVGEARADARAGQTVRVRNLDSKREILGVAVAQGIVDVAP